MLRVGASRIHQGAAVLNDGILIIRGATFEHNGAAIGGALMNEEMAQ